MFLFLLLDGGQHLARLGVAELKHGGVVHAGDIFFRAQQIGQQIGVALFFSAAGRGFQVLFPPSDGRPALCSAGPGWAGRVPASIPVTVS